MIRTVVVAWLTLLWLALWRDATPANLVSGVVVALVVTALFPEAQAPRRHTIRPWPLVVFHAYFAWKLLEANVVLAREILSRGDRIRTGIVAVPLSDCSDLVVSVVANAITLTPGTLTLEVTREPRALYVHVLHLHSIEAVRRDVWRIEHLALRAFGVDDPGPAPVARP
ncbi:MAG: Na+/H+ antiporter subunit E [Acidimicrobiales bacterium]